MGMSWRVAGIAAVAGFVGGVVGALLIGIGQHSAASGPEAPSGGSAESAHVQDVTLCTTYALIRASMPASIEKGADALPAIAPLRLGLTENPDASPQIRDAIS